MGKREELNKVRKEVFKERLDIYEGPKIEYEEEYEDEEEGIMLKVLEIRSNILRYVRDKELPLCEYLELEDVGNFLNKILCD